MNTKLMAVAGLVFCSGAVACGSVPPKVLVAHDFQGDDKSVKMMLQDSGHTDPASKRRLYNVWMRMCDVNATSEAGCKDTQVLDNVVPGSVY